MPWTHDNLPDILWQADPDGALSAWVDAAEHEAMEQSRASRAIRDAQDVNTCAARFLPYIADSVGLRLNAFDPPDVWRAQIRSAIGWYKERGKASAFRSVFLANRLRGSVLPLWIDAANRAVASETSPGAAWKPHARIDVRIDEYPENVAGLDDPFGYALRAVEEVRPAHVRLRSREAWFRMEADAFPFPPSDADAFHLPSAGVWDVVVPAFIACGQWFPITLRDRKFFEDHPSAPSGETVTQRVVPVISAHACGMGDHAPVHAELDGNPLGPVWVDTNGGAVPLLGAATGTRLPALEMEHPAGLRAAVNGTLTLSARLTDCAGGDTQVVFAAAGGGYAGVSACVTVTERVCWSIVRYDAVFDCVENKWCLAGQEAWESPTPPDVVDTWITAPDDACRRSLFKAQGRPGTCST